MPISYNARHVSLALSGGNALGAYAAGAYVALHDAGRRVDRVSAASIGAVNGAILAGNPPHLRVQKLQEFWSHASTWTLFSAPPSVRGAREAYNRLHVMQSMVMGRPGLFATRPTGYFSLFPGTPPDIGLFDAQPLRDTLERLVDFHYLNNGELQLTIASVDVETGEGVYFDNRVQAIRPEHVLASAAFIPGFPPVEIDGRLLCDPGMFCNMPLDPLLLEAPPADHVCFAVDLFDARGGRPFSMDTALERAQDIAFASQSLRTIEAFRREYRLRRLLDQQVAKQRDADNPVGGLGNGRYNETSVVLLAYQPAAHELGTKALEFSAASLSERWTAGQQDMAAAIEALETGRATTQDPGFSVYDCRRPLGPRRQGRRDTAEPGTADSAEAQASPCKTSG